MPKLNKNEVLVPGSLALHFEIDLSGGHANNFLVQNVTRALVDKLFVKFGGAIVQDTVGNMIYNNGIEGKDMWEEALTAPAPDIPVLCEQLAILVATGKAKEAIGMQLTHEQVKCLSDEDVEKYTKRYET